MNTELSLESLNLSLYRYPKRSNEQLQAWDSADELIINHISALTLPDQAKIIIFNDSFGALTCAHAHHDTTSVSDSWISQSGIKQNLAENEFNTEITIQDCQATLPVAPDLVLIKVPRTLALLEYQLAMLSHVVTENTVIVAGAKVKEIHNSTLAIFEKYLGETKTSLAKKKSRLIFSEVKSSKKIALPEPSHWTVEHNNFSLTNLANVFSSKSLDIGARFFLQHLPKGKYQHIIDLGCGNGVIGTEAARLNPQAEITFADESFMAVASAKMNAETNLPKHQSKMNFLVNNCLYNFEPHSVDLVLCNPPFHQQQAITDHIAWQMFKDAHRALSWGGEIYIVGNRHLDYHVKLERLFNNYEIIASNAKFVIIKAKK